MVPAPCKNNRNDKEMEATVLQHDGIFETNECCSPFDPLYLVKLSDSYKHLHTALKEF
jgi:hypothetical protein